jgi:hypothetical protein
VKEEVAAQLTKQLTTCEVRVAGCRLPFVRSWTILLLAQVEACATKRKSRCMGPRPLCWLVIACMERA